MENEDYWIIVEHRRWKLFKRPRMKSFFLKENITFSEAKEFVERCRDEFTSNRYEYAFRIGVTRGSVIRVVY